MLWFFLGLFVGATLGAVGMGILAGGKDPTSGMPSSFSQSSRSSRYTGGYVPMHHRPRHQVSINGCWWNLLQHDKDKAEVWLGDVHTFVSKKEIQGVRTI